MSKKFDGESTMLIGALLLFIIAIFYAAITSKKQDLLPSQKVLTNYGVNVYCDKETNIEYLIYVGDDKGGFTVRYDSNGKIKRCAKSKKNK